MLIGAGVDRQRQRALVEVDGIGKVLQVGARRAFDLRAVRVVEAAISRSTRMEVRRDGRRPLMWGKRSGTPLKVSDAAASVVS
jgi:hypothetical protein